MENGGTDSCPSINDALPLGFNGIVHIKAEPRNGILTKGGSSVVGPAAMPRSPGNSAFSGAESRPSYSERVKFGIPEWGSPLPGMASAPLPTPRHTDHHVRDPASVSPEHPATPADHGPQKAQSEPFTNSPPEEPAEPVAHLLPNLPAEPLSADSDAQLSDPIAESHVQEPAQPAATITPKASAELAADSADMQPAEGNAEQHAEQPVSPVADTMPEIPSKQIAESADKQSEMSHTEPPCQQPAMTGAETMPEHPAVLVAEPLPVPPAVLAPESAPELGAEQPAESQGNWPESAARSLAQVLAEAAMELPAQPDADVAAQQPAHPPAGMAVKAAKTLEDPPADRSADKPAGKAAQAPAQAGAVSVAQKSKPRKVQRPDPPTLSLLPAEQPADLPSNLPADLPEPAEACAQPQADADDSQTAHESLSDIAALDELHAYIMSCGGVLSEGWTVHFPRKGNSDAKPMYLPPEDFTAAGNEESKGPFTEKHLVARALGLLPPGSRSLRRLVFNPRGSKDAAADTDCEDEMVNVLALQLADVQDSAASAVGASRPGSRGARDVCTETDQGTELEDAPSDAEDASDGGNSPVDNSDPMEVEGGDGHESEEAGDAAAADDAAAAKDALQVEGGDGHESEEAGDAAAADDAAAAEELQKLAEYVKDCGGGLPEGWSVRRIRCFGDRHRPLYVAPVGFQAVVGQPSKPTYTSKAKVAAALGRDAGGKAKAKTRSKQDAPCETTTPKSSETSFPKSKKQRTLDSISAAAADESNVINIDCAKAPPPVIAPSKHAAIGWRVRVRDQHDRRRMINAIVRDHDPPTGQYLLRFERGGEEWRHLTDNVRWISASPEEEEEEESSAQSSSDNATSEVSEECESDGSRPSPAPPMRQNRAARHSNSAIEKEVPLDEPSNMDRDQQPDEPFNMELEQQPDLADLEAPARTGTPLAAVTPQAAAQRTSYQGAWNKTKTGIAEKDTEALYECMAEIGVHLAPGWSSTYSTTVRRGKPEKDICYVPPAGFKPVNGSEGRMYWSRPDVARAHGASSWPQRCAPRGGINPIQTMPHVPAQENADSTPLDADSGIDLLQTAPNGPAQGNAGTTAVDPDSGDPEEQKEWLQEFLNKEFEKEGWGDGRIAWQDVAKRKSDLSNNEIFQRVKALNKRAEDEYPLLKDVCGKDGTAVIKKKIMMLFVNATKRAKKRKQEGIEEFPRPVAAPRTVAMPSTQRHTPAATAQRSPAATNAQRSTPVAVAQPAAPAPQSRHASEEAQEQPHVQFPDDSPDAKQGPGTSARRAQRPSHRAGSHRPYQAEQCSTPSHVTSPSMQPQENALMPMPDMSMRVAEQQPDGQTGQVGTGEQGKRRTVAEHFFFFLKQPGATPEFLQELHRLAQSAM